ncbi:CGP-CTERM sorting domain-containing protein [Thermococcus sp. 21S9]|uniref:CGP-CTERM sorting domain-containing protein n=1 Tax=Thermococcus sp. 21S9 TaxID=1638223 RepID=UPI00143AED2D|nr:CGP-CTERM sorting domain-containing protein [Thermococcus sp. 21S9]NJE55226.1 CGP-CTERM sorting domain-containing protein [Thermococcus sp. 21S9]
MSKMKGIVLMLLLMVSLMYQTHEVSGKGTCPPEVELPDPVLFATTPYIVNNTIAFELDVYYFYQFYEGMCPISSLTDRLQCLDAEALDFRVHYTVENGSTVGRLGGVDGVPLKTYPLKLLNGSVVELEGLNVSFPFGVLKTYLSALNITGTFTQNCTYSPDLKPLLAKFNGTADVVSRMRGFVYNGTIYVYFPQAEFVDCDKFIPEEFRATGNYVSPIIPLVFNGSTPSAPPLILAYRNGSMEPVLKLKTERRKGDWGCYYYVCSPSNLELPKPVEPPVELEGGRNYSYVYVAPHDVSVNVSGFTNGTFALFLLKLSASGILIPGGPNVPADIHYVLLFGYDGRLFQVNLSSILRTFNPPEEDDYGNPAFYFGGADEEIFHLGVAFVNGTPYLGVSMNGSKNITLIRLIPGKKEWIKAGSVSYETWEKMVRSSTRETRLSSVSHYSKYFLSTPLLEYVPVKGGVFVYPARYSVSFYGLPAGYAKVGKRILPTCSLWPVYAFLDNDTVYGLFRVGGNFTLYPKLVEYSKAPRENPNANTSTNLTTSPAGTGGTTNSTGSNTVKTPERRESKSICGPGLMVLLALLALLRER